MGLVTAQRPPVSLLRQLAGGRRKALLARIAPAAAALLLAAIGAVAVAVNRGDVALPATFAAYMLALLNALRYNHPLIRTVASGAAMVHGLAVWQLSGEPLLAGAAVVFALAPLQPEGAVRVLGYHIEWVPLGMLLFGGALVAAAGPPRAATLTVAPIGIVCLAAAVNATLAALYLVQQGRPAWRVRVGELVPDFELPLRGDPSRSFRLSSRRGRYVLLAFQIGDWCPVCQVQMRIYKKEAQRLADHGVTLVLISPATSAPTATFAADGLELVQLADAEHGLADQLGSSLLWKDQQTKLPLPASFLVGPDGRLCYSSSPEDALAFLDPGQVPAILKRLGEPT